MQRGRSRPGKLLPPLYASQDYIASDDAHTHRVGAIGSIRSRSPACCSDERGDRRAVQNANRVFGTSGIRRTSILPMRDLNRHRDAIRRLKKKLRLGDSTASNNIAVAYRELGDFRRAFQWWRRTAGPHDGDAWLEVGYCLQYGIGTRRDPTAAIQAYRRAIRTYYTTEFGCEEAQYHLAVALLDRGDTRYRREIERLLTMAAEDADYPEAADLLEQVGKSRPSRICRCRRELARRLGGKAHCPLHRRPRVRRTRKA